MNARRPIAILLLALGLAAVLLPAARADADAVELRDSATVTGGVVKLKDIARLTGDEATRLADVTLAPVGTAGELTLTRDQVCTTLSEHGVNWGRVICRGSLQVLVHVASPTAVATTAAAPASDHSVTLVDPAPPAPGTANPVVTLSTTPAAPVAPATASGTVKQRVMDWMRDQVGRAGDMEVKLDADRDGMLDTQIGSQRVEVEPETRSTIGRVPLVVRLYDGDRLTQTIRIRATVRVRRAVLVARHTLSRGEAVRDGDVRLEPVWFDSAQRQPLTDPAAALGQRTTQMVRAGSVVYDGDLAPAILVHRGQLVTVRCIAGALVVKTVGRAEGDGSLGQIVTIRNERTRDEYQARISGPQEAVMLAGNPAAVAAAAPGGAGR